MIGSASLSRAMRGVDRNALDLPVAGLAALAVAFLVYAVPTDMLSALVAGSGLPSLIPAAQPPLGSTARMMVGAGGAAAAFALVLLLLRLLDRSGAVEEEEEAQPETPRARRRDFHPDAPAPRPISAARDLGEPEELRPKAATPVWLAGIDPAEPVEDAASVALEEPPAVELEQQEPEVLELAHAEPEPRPEPEPEAFAPNVENADPAPSPPSGTSIPELMARLERGLAERRTRAAPPAAPEPPQVFPEAGDDRLRSAIDSLQRLAARQH